MNSGLRERVPGMLMLVITMLFCIFPLVSMLSAALQPQGSVPSGLSWPSDPQWHNFADAWKVANITPLLVSSLILVVGVVPIVALCATMAGYALGQLKILQEAIALSVFVPFAFFYMKQRLTLDYLWAGLCILGACYFMFRGNASAS